MKACHQHGAAKICAAASHGLFVRDADKNLVEPALEQLVITDSVRPFRLQSGAVRKKLEVLKSASLFSKAIRRIHSDGSIVDLLAI